MSQKLADLFAQAGGRVGGRGGAYQIDARENLVREFRKGKLGNQIRADIKGVDLGPEWSAVARGAAAPVRALGVMADYAGRALDTLTSPLFDKLIPRVKQGAWSSEMADFIRQHPTADERALLIHARQTMDSIDDRFGEMNQDNLFWNRYAKQLMNLFTVSVGWEFGTLRAFGHAALDVGTGHWNSTRARWLPAFLTMSAYQNSAYQYLNTATAPWQTNTPITNTMLAPRSGGTIPGGSPEDAILPGYQKEEIRALTEAYRVPDFVGALQSVGAYALSKQNPFWQAVEQGLSGQDWDDRSLRLKYEVAHGAPPSWWQYLGDIAGRAGLPIAVGSIGAERVGTAVPFWERFMGIRPAGMNLSDPARYDQIMQQIHRRAVQKERWRENRYNATLEK